MRAAIYARLSTVDQEPENQLRELRRYIQARGWTGSGRLPLMPDSHGHKQHPHVLKHSIATHLVLANVNLALVKMQLGHKSINRTLRYVSTTDRQASQATVAALMEIF